MLIRQLHDDHLSHMLQAGIFFAMTIGVYGLGRFGTLWAGMLATQFNVLVCSRSPHAAPEGTRLVEPVALGDCDAVFLCTSISSMPETCRFLSAYLHPGQTVLDTCSVKVWPMQHMQQNLPPSVNIIGTHPMFGPDSARNGWNGLPVVVCPQEGRQGAGPGSVGFWNDHFSAMGLSVQLMSADDHDREAARTQGLTHIIGRMLEDMGCEPSDMGTLGYRKLMDIKGQTCNDTWQLFIDLQTKNPYTTEVRKELRRALDTICDRLQNQTTTTEGK